MQTIKNSKLIGVDLGGTNVRAGLVKNGRIAALKSRAISSGAAQNVVIEEIFETIAAVLQPGVRGIGIGVPSLVHDGVVFTPNNIPSWQKVPLKKILEKRFNLPVFVDNDANCFALGELYFGVGRGYENLVGIIIGTGLGSGVVIHGKLYSGSNGGAGEIGNITYKEKNFEYYCSGRYFQREFGTDGYTLQQAADRGDYAAREKLASIGDHIAEVIMAALYAFDPEIIVLGGSGSKGFPYFESRMRARLKTFHFQNSLKRLKIIPTKKVNIAVLAAAALCLDNQ
jgi:glucokinase